MVCVLVTLFLLIPPLHRVRILNIFSTNAADIYLGGLGMSEAKIGTQMAIRSFIHIVMMIGYNQIVGGMKTLDIYKVTHPQNFPPSC